MIRQRERGRVTTMRKIEAKMRRWVQTYVEGGDGDVDDGDAGEAKVRLVLILVIIMMGVLILVMIMMAVAVLITPGASSHI